MLLPRIDTPSLGFVEALKVETAEYTNGVGREFIAVAAHLKMETSHMNLKIAAMLIVSVLMSANTSYGGELLDRMLGRAGCSSCAAPAAKSCGCGGGGLLDKLLSGCGCKCKSADVLNVDADAGCGCEAAASSCGCDSAPAVEASPCGCEEATVVETSPCECDAAPVEASPCGCEAAPVAEASPCGCEAEPSCGCEAAAPSCGCEAAPAVEASPCGCEAAPAEPVGLFARLRSMGCGCKSAPAAAPSCGCEAAAPSCGCEAAPAVEASPCDCEAAVVEASPCGCDAAPAVEASPCGCDAAPAVAATPCGAPAAVIPSGCGCNAAPAVSTCGCNEPSGGGGPGSYAPGGNRPKLTLLDRLRGNRVARNRDGKVIGVCNDGCNPPCPQKPVDCGCGGGEYIIEAAPCSSCNTCGGGEVIYSDAMPTSGCASGACGGATPVYGDGVALPAAVSEGSGSRVEPVAPAMTEGTLQGVEEVEETERRDITQPSVSDEEDDPIVDPGAFVPRPTNTLGS